MEMKKDNRISKLTLMEKYELCEEIGSGGSGRVWKAYDRHLERYVAVKQFEKAATEEKEKVSAAEWEAEMMKELRHPALPAILDYLEDEKAGYLVMEYIDGVNLLKYIEENGKVKQEQAVQWAIELADVLLYLHERKRPVLYRDMKPANVIIDGSKRARLIDFGSVCFRYEEREKAQRVVGTKGYAAPEQLDASEAKLPDETCDGFGLGATLFHMLTGCNPSLPPFLIQPIRSYDRRLSGELERIITKATAITREKRYTGMRQMKRALEQYKRKDRIRNFMRKILTAVYYSGLAIGTYHFLSCWQKAERYLMGIGQPDRIVGNGMWSGLTQKQAVETQMLLIAVMLLLLCMGSYGIGRFRKRGKRSLRLEKNIVLTEKKGSMGFWLLFPILLSVCMFVGEFASAQEEQTLFVNVRNEQGQKLLIRYDAEYPVADTLRLELPIDNFEAGERYELRLDCTNRETGETHSRIFYLKGLEP